MQALHMNVTIDKRYRPCTGRSILRPTDRQVAGLTPGDLVIVYHAEDPKADKTPVASEILRVKSVATGAFDVMVKAHAKTNHTGLSLAALLGHLGGDAPLKDAQYTVIYFD